MTFYPMMSINIVKVKSKLAMVCTGWMFPGIVSYTTIPVYVWWVMQHVTFSWTVLLSTIFKITLEIFHTCPITLIPFTVTLYTYHVTKLQHYTLWGKMGDTQTHTNAYALILTTATDWNVRWELCRYTFITQALQLQHMLWWEVCSRGGCRAETLGQCLLWRTAEGWAE